MLWVLQKYRDYFAQTKAARLIGSSPEIIREERLDGISRLLSTTDRLSHLVIVRGKAFCGAALRYGDGFVPFIGAERADGVSDQEARLRAYKLVDPGVFDDADALARLFKYDKILKNLQEMAGYVDELLPKRLPPLPAEIRDRAVPGDVYGIFSRNSYWWWQKKTGTLHILGAGKGGRGSACTFIIPPPEGYSYSNTTLLAPVFNMMVDCWRLKRLVIHEGITDFWGASLCGVTDDNCFLEVKLPRSLKKMSRLNCYTEKMKVPREMKQLDLFALITLMGGHLDPVTYGVKKLILPAGITFRDSLPEAEPIDYLEEIEIYGKASDHALDAWYQAGMLNVHLDQMLDISYPAAWDKGTSGAYAENVLAFIKKKSPDRIDWSKGQDMGRPQGFRPWSEEDYEAFRRHFHPLQRRKEIPDNSYLSFGRYPHSGSGADMQDIEWQVLATESGRILLLSRYALDAQPYHDSFEDVTWSLCSLRRWLNEDFFNQAFSEAEKEVILAIPQDNEPYQETKDKVFLLSCEEAEKIFEGEYYDEVEEARRCSPTAYALRRSGAHYISRTESIRYWLRSPGREAFIAASINSYGSLDRYRPVNDRLFIRPAIWVGL